jgi:hypothetical protein
MLGERQNPWVTQSAWIKTLMATLVRPWEGRGKKIGGLFGSRLREGGEVLGWSRAQQAAFLIYSWQKLHNAVHGVAKPWATELREDAKKQGFSVTKDNDPAFYGNYSLIVTDQGVRGFLHIINDLCFVMAPNLKLDRWQLDKKSSASDAGAVSLALKSVTKEPLATFLESIAAGLATFDWRTSAAPNISEELRRQKLVFRGSSGYKELRSQLLQHLGARRDDVGKAVERLAGLA